MKMCDDNVDYANEKKNPMDISTKYRNFHPKLELLRNQIGWHEAYPRIWNTYSHLVASMRLTSTQPLSALLLIRWSIRALLHLCVKILFSRIAMTSSKTLCKMRMKYKNKISHTNEAHVHCHCYIMEMPCIDVCRLPWTILSQSIRMNRTIFIVNRQWVHFIYNSNGRVADGHSSTWIFLVFQWTVFQKVCPSLLPPPSLLDFRIVFPNARPLFR